GSVTLRSSGRTASRLSRKRSRTKGRARPTETVISIGTCVKGLVSTASIPASSMASLLLFLDAEEGGHSRRDSRDDTIEVDARLGLAELQVDLSLAQRGLVRKAQGEVRLG